MTIHFDRPLNAEFKYIIGFQIYLRDRELFSLRQY